MFKEYIRRLKLKAHIIREFKEHESPSKKQLKVMTFEDGTTVAFILYQCGSYRKFGFKMYDKNSKIISCDEYKF